MKLLLCYFKILQRAPNSHSFSNKFQQTLWRPVRLLPTFFDRWRYQHVFKHRQSDSSFWVPSRVKDNHLSSAHTSPFTNCFRLFDWFSIGNWRRWWKNATRLVAFTLDLVFLWNLQQCWWVARKKCWLHKTFSHRAENRFS